MIPFQYVDFWDVPRTIALQNRGKVLLLQSAFNDELDEYPDEYRLYELPASLGAELTSRSLKTPGLYLGTIAISGVRFDESKRHSLDATVLDRLLDGEG